MGGKKSCKHCASTRECGCQVCLDKAGIGRSDTGFTTVECQRCKHGMEDEGKYEKEMCKHCWGSGSCSCGDCYNEAFDFEEDYLKKGSGGSYGDLKLTCHECNGKGYSVHKA